MKVGVVTPCYNQADLLPEALESVAWQTVRPHVVVIVDDCSPDAEDIQRVYTQFAESGFGENSCVVSHPVNRGPSAARNTGMDICTWVGCDAILPLDADDIIEPEMIEEGLKVLQEVDIAYPSVRFFGKWRGKTLYPLRDPEELAQIILSRNEMVSCSLFKAEVWLKVKERNGTGYDPELHKPEHYGWEDWLFWIEAHLLGFRARAIGKTLFNYRTREDSNVGVANQCRGTWPYFREKIQRLYGVELGPHPVFNPS